MHGGISVVAVVPGGPAVAVGVVHARAVVVVAHGVVIVARGVVVVAHGVVVVPCRAVRVEVVHVSVTVVVHAVEAVLGRTREDVRGEGVAVLLVEDTVAVEVGQRRDRGACGKGREGCGREGEEAGNRHEKPSDSSFEQPQKLDLLIAQTPTLGDPTSIPAAS